MKLPNSAATRERVTGEITPVRAEHSATKDNDEVKNGAGNAIDLDLATSSFTVADTIGGLLLKINLGKVNCVEKLITFLSTGDSSGTWTCSKDDCSKCEGSWCSLNTMAVSTEGAVSDLSPVSDCRYGDTVEVRRNGGGAIGMFEIAVIGKEGT